MQGIRVRIMTMKWPTFFDGLAADPKWTWTQDWLQWYELVIEVDEVDPKTGRRKAWAAKGKALDWDVPGNLFRVGCSGRTASHLRWIFFDLDVGHSTNPHEDMESALADARRLRDWFGFGEVRLSSSGRGVHLGVPMPWTDFRASDGPRIAKTAILATGVRADPSATGRQCRFLWIRDPSPDSFRLIDPLDERKLPQEPSERLLEAFHGMSMSGEPDEFSVGPAYQAPVLVSAAKPAGRPRDLQPIGPSLLETAKTMARNYMRDRMSTGRSRLGARNFVDIKVLANDLGLPTHEVNEILSSHGCPVVTDADINRMCSYCKSKRGWMVSSRRKLIELGSDEHVVIKAPTWALSPQGEPWDALGKSTYLVWHAIQVRVKEVDGQGWSNPVRLLYEDMGNRAIKTNQKAIHRLLEVGLLKRVQDEFHWSIRCGTNEVEWDTIQKANKFRIRKRRRGGITRS